MPRQSHVGHLHQWGDHMRAERKPERFQGVEVVLQERIELSTSPLPRECSTTELLQRRCRAGEPPRGVAGE